MLYGRRPTGKEGSGDYIYWTGCTQKGKCLLLSGREWEGIGSRPVVSQPGCGEGTDRGWWGDQPRGPGGDGELAAHCSDAGVGGGGCGPFPPPSNPCYCISEGEDGCYRCTDTCRLVEGGSVATGIHGASADSGATSTGADPGITGGDAHTLQEPGSRGVDAGGEHTSCDGCLWESGQGVDVPVGALTWGQDYSGYPAWGDRPYLGDGTGVGQGVVEATGVVPGVPGPEQPCRVRPRNRFHLSGRGGRRVAFQACPPPSVLSGDSPPGALLRRQDPLRAVDQRGASVGRERAGTGCISSHSEESGVAGTLRQDQTATRVPGGANSCRTEAGYTGLSRPQSSFPTSRQRVAPDRLRPARPSWSQRGPMVIERLLTRGSGPLPTCAAHASAYRCRTKLPYSASKNQGLDRMPLFIDEPVEPHASGLPRDPLPDLTAFPHHQSVIACKRNNVRTITVQCYSPRHAGAGT